MLLYRLPCLGIVGLWLTACVTINVYFPAAAAEKAADKIIDKIQGTSVPKATPADIPEDQHSLAPSMRLLFDWFIPVAIAKEPDLDISSTAIQKIITRQTERYKKLEPLYNTGAVGLTHDGLITLRDLTKVPLKSRSEVNNWIAAENQDRLALYREIAIANRHPDWEENIRLTFAKRWIERALPGWWYQDEKKNWHSK